jgi:hypothetical protein
MMNDGPSEFTLRLNLYICEYETYVRLLRTKINDEDDDKNNDNNKGKVVPVLN